MKNRAPLLLVVGLVLLFVVLKEVERRTAQNMPSAVPAPSLTTPLENATTPSESPAPRPQMQPLPIPISTSSTSTPIMPQASQNPPPPERPKSRLRPLPSNLRIDDVEGEIAKALKLLDSEGPLPSLE